MDQAKANHYAALMGFTPQQVQDLQSQPFEQAVLALEALKKQAKVLYRKLVFQNHPDRNPGDAQASQKLADLAEVLRHIEALNLQRRVQRPVMQVYYVQVQQPIQQAPTRTAPSYSTNTSSTTTTTTYQARRVAFVRPV